MSINRGMDKEDVVCIYNGILLSHKRKKIGSIVELQMDLETIIQNEVSQKEKQILYINTYMWNLGEGNGTPLQYSCLENPTDGGA